MSKEIAVDREEKLIKLKSGKRGFVVVGLFVCWLVFVGFISIRLKWERSDRDTKGDALPVTDI